jgi:hypothetical protein
LSIRVRCPNGHGLSVPDERKGVRVRCPKCKELFRADPLDETPDKREAVPKKKAPVRAAARLNDDDDDTGDGSPETPEERRKLRQTDRKVRLRKVSLGLLLHIIRMWGITVLIFFTLLYSIFSGIAAAAKAPDVERLAPEALMIFGAIALVCAIMVAIMGAAIPIVGMVGSGFCCFVPKKAEGRGLIITSIVFDVMALFASGLMALAPLFPMDPVKKANLVALLEPASIFCSFAGIFSFILFLKQVALYVKKPLLASAALNLLTWLIVVVISGPIILFALGFLTVLIIVLLGPVLTIGALFLVIILWFAAFYYLWFRPMLNLITSVRTAVNEAI